MSASAAAMSSPAATNGGDSEDKEQKRRKQVKRMTKILAFAWQESDACFQHNDDDNNENVTCLASIGNKLDNKEYRFGKHGWEDFCKDLGGVYNAHKKG
jgi:hypothetical protein